MTYNSIESNFCIQLSVSQFVDISLRLVYHGKKYQSHLTLISLFGRFAISISI